MLLHPSYLCRRIIKSFAKCMKWERYWEKVLYYLGAFGEVRLCTEKASKMERAVKIMPNAALKPEDKKLLTFEMRILKKLDHPNIIKIYEIFEEKAHIFIVTEYCKGGDLFDRIEKLKKLSEEETRIIIKQLASALYYCHSNHIVHRDIKPENILMQSSEVSDLRIKLIDFGTAVEYNCLLYTSPSPRDS